MSRRPIVGRHADAHRQTIILPRKLHGALAQIGKQEKASYGSLVRTAIRDFVRFYNATVPEGARVELDCDLDGEAASL